MKKIVKNIFRIIDRKEKISLARLIVSDVVISVLDISFLVILLYIVHFYTDAHHATGTDRTGTARFPQSLFDRFPLLMVGLFFLLFSLKNLVSYFVLRKQFSFVYGVASRLSKNNLARYLRGSFFDYVNINSSVHNRKINQQPIEFGHYVLAGFQTIISQSLLIMITILTTLLFNPVLFLLLFIILTPPVILTGFLIKRKMSSIRKTAKPVSERTLQYLQEALSGFVESNVYERDHFFIDRYDTQQSAFNEFLSRQQVIQNIPSKLIEVFAIFGFFILIFINSYTDHSNAIQLITIGAFMGAAYKIIPGIVRIVNCVGQIRTYGFTASDLAEEQLVSTPGRYLPDQVPAAQTPPNSAQEPPPKKRISSVEFAGVSFRYSGESVLADFSMRLSAGELIGLSGVSGKGKTTVANLLLGFAESSAGSILINGQPTQAADRVGYWKTIAYVKQQTFMITDTVLRNIVLDEQAEDPARLDEVIRKCGLEELTGIFPEGLNKRLTENGRNISGGQRQRIAFARALYKEADLIILDEPFNELDEVSEGGMMQLCLDLARQGMAILLITHNKKSLSVCHKIISL